jgi:hypothetical protein
MLAEPRHARVEARRLVPQSPAAEEACQGQRRKDSRDSRSLSKNRSDPQVRGRPRIVTRLAL